MTNWYIKEFGKLTGVSVRTLHHYDKIGLLKPSIRQENGYRLYSEADLLKQQQIIALKFFGFELSHIKNLLSEDIDIIDHLMVQSRFLEEKANALLDASQTLKNVISTCCNDKSIHWEAIIKLIEVYRMTQQLEKTWAGKALTPEELKEYAHFKEELKNRFTQDEETAFHREWADLVKQVSDNLSNDPASDIGISLAKQCTKMVNSLYGEKYAGLKNAVWEKGFKGGHVKEEDHSLSPDMVKWLDSAMDAYWRNRLYDILDRIGVEPDNFILPLWDNTLNEMYGDDQNLKNDLIKIAMSDERVTAIAKDWLKKFL